MCECVRERERERDVCVCECVDPHNNDALPVNASDFWIRNVCEVYLFKC